MAMDEFVMSWVRGWAVSREVPEPEEVTGGLRARVGLPGHRIRYVLRSGETATAAHLGRTAAEPGTWIKIADTDEALRAALPDVWQMTETCYLMSTSLTAKAAEPPAPYTLRTALHGPVVIATVHDHAGDLAATAQYGPTGDIAVIDKVVTEPRHRRRGLGRVVMGALATHALDHGITTGVLVATDEGRSLYRTLGWSDHGPIAAAHVPEDPA
ncbi:GNAT family N-acetyltransferase [Actinoplanes sp. NBRC 101535]|uniref:GNAT family N-acetyltransferase n=1 Tax=Actinoplanes sp. NBRC 101535 TaxID=3032196 RepID=UPI0024A0E583|nr:GNAT family N-acetyltransferase [Actinoplanes sp. NBRC 101535]GLY02503.1 hypothetical protein Acsp01_28820 [Actinoplanes sp. NBRC 101535]